MTIALPPELPPEADLVTLDGVSWETYESLLNDFEETNQHKRVLYDRGRMEILSPLPKHEMWKSLLARFVEVIADAKDIPIVTFGSTTWKRKDKKRGLEPDECFYIQHEAQVRGQLEFDLKKDPPPDLAIEVNLRRYSVDKLTVYASLKIPELWCYDGTEFQTFVLQPDGEYRSVTKSAALPFLRPADLKQFLDRFGTTDQNSLIRAVREWARSLHT